MNKKKIGLYMHGGSYNHGCEAIVRSTLSILGFNDATLFSKYPEQDKALCLYEVCEIENQGNLFKPYSLHHILLKMESIFKQNTECYTKWKYENVLQKIADFDIWFSIGGDNYCYEDSLVSELQYINEKIQTNKKLSILWGCSIEPEYVEHKANIVDLKRYKLIFARESITYEALVKAGLRQTSKLYPDPAFALERKQVVLPKEFIEGKIIGINMSPLIQRWEQKENIIYINYRRLLEYIIQNTDNDIALIPHVVWEHNNDLEPLTKLYEEFRETGRVILIEDHNCMELKEIISHCRMFIGARTHATIAAYSTCVPTLVVGYSVKAKGIAKDIFGTYENYVVPVQSLKDENDLVKAFQWLNIHEDEIRTYLQKFMPSYIEKAWQAGEEIRRLIGE